MMKTILTMMALLSITAASAQTPGFRVEGIGTVGIPVTLDKMTNIVFPQPIQAGVKVSRDVMVQKVKGVENVVELKALRKDFTPTNLSVYDRDGRLYSFGLYYISDTTTLNYRVIPTSNASIDLTGLPANSSRLQEDAHRLASQHGFLHLSVRSQRLRLRLKGVYLKDSLQWLTFSLTNRSPIPYNAEQISFYLQARKAINRKAIQQLPVEPVYSSDQPPIPGKQKASFAAGFQPFLIAHTQRLVVQVRARDGRVLVLKCRAKELLKARS
jgi:hypothetical protein